MIHQLLTENDDKSSFTVEINLESLRYLLAPNTNMITADFKRRALISAVDMINRYTSMRIELLGSFKKG